jgi:hypothetical protein
MTGVNRGIERPVDRGRARLLVAATAVVLLTGCGAGPQDGPRAAAQGFARAWSAQDGSAVCRWMAPQTRGEVAQSAKKPCPEAVLGEELPPAGKVRQARVWGRSAQVRTTQDTLFLAQFASGWRVVAAGCRPRAGGPYDCQVQGG